MNKRFSPQTSRTIRIPSLLGTCPPQHPFTCDIPLFMEHTWVLAHTWVCIQVEYPYTMAGVLTYPTVVMYPYSWNTPGYVLPL